MRGVAGPLTVVIFGRQSDGRLEVSPRVDEIMFAFIRQAAIGKSRRVGGIKPNGLGEIRDGAIDLTLAAKDYAPVVQPRKISRI